MTSMNKYVFNSANDIYANMYDPACMIGWAKAKQLYNDNSGVYFLC